jgi:hypothetical protein
MFSAFWSASAARKVVAVLPRPIKLPKDDAKRFNSPYGSATGQVRTAIPDELPITRRRELDERTAGKCSTSRVRAQGGMISAMSSRSMLRNLRESKLLKSLHRLRELVNLFLPVNYTWAPRDKLN